MDFGAIIKRAWQITWRYKALWVLGVFAGVSGCQSGGSGGGGGSGWQTNSGELPWGGTDFGSFRDFIYCVVQLLHLSQAGWTAADMRDK